MMRARVWLALVVIAVGAMALSGCGRPAVEPDPTPPPEPVETEPPVVNNTPPERPDDPPTPVDLNEKYADVLQTIYFDFDSFDIKRDSRDRLEKIAGLMRSHPSFRLRIEGHCDERGTAEYNLGLGENRAQAAKRYLSSLGVSSTRFRTRSWGEERPADRGNNERAWAKNRRAEFFLEAGS